MPARSSAWRSTTTSRCAIAWTTPTTCCSGSWSWRCRRATRPVSSPTTPWSPSCAFPTRWRCSAARCSARSWRRPPAGAPRWRRSTSRRRTRWSRWRRSRIRRDAARPDADAGRSGRGMSASFLFYDLETWGTDPRRTRIAQFAAIRTGPDLEAWGEPVEFLVRPADDLLPSPGASLVTGLAPQDALRTGLTEAEAFARIIDELGRPGTCTLGYNSLRFDDEFIRHGLFRNFHDPYEREWRNGNCRWDLLDVMRLAHALRPEGIAWPAREDGATSFRLEHLAEANGVRIGDAHEALSDVRALIGLARLLRAAQPRLWAYALALRDKRHVAGMLDTVAM